MSIFKSNRRYHEEQMTWIQAGLKFSELEKEIRGLKDDVYPIIRHNLSRNPYPLGDKVDGLIYNAGELHDRIRKLEIKNGLY